VDQKSDKCDDCGEEWKLMCEPITHPDRVTGAARRVCHKCHRDRLDEERAARRIASHGARVPRENGVPRDAVAGGGGQVSIPVVE